MYAEQVDPHLYLYLAYGVGALLLGGYALAMWMEARAMARRNGRLGVGGQS